MLFYDFFENSYRKAPAHPFPAAYCDCLQVTKYVSMNARTLNVDPSFLMVAGDGAGGNLAAAVARKMASKIFLQVLINPALQVITYVCTFKKRRCTLTHSLIYIHTHTQTYVVT